MFLDIRDFTRFAEKRTPEEVVGYLNTIFDVGVDAVVKHHGIVNKFLGDGFMAVFGAPIAERNPCASAIDAGREVLARIDALVAGGQIPPTRVGLGLHAGKAIVGNIGSSLRKEYTVIGDVVNVASRVESLERRASGSQMLVTEEVWTAAGRNSTRRRGPTSRCASAAARRPSGFFIWRERALDLDLVAVLESSLPRPQPRALKPPCDEAPRRSRRRSPRVHARLWRRPGACAPARRRARESPERPGAASCGRPWRGCRPRPRGESPS